MFRLPGIIMFFLILFTASTAFALGPWIMEWYALDPVQGTDGIQDGIDTDWIDEIFGEEEADIARLGKVPGTKEKGEYKTRGEDGSVVYRNSKYIVGAGGADIWGTADAFRFTYKELSGDFEIALEAESLAQTNDWAKIGPMVRQSNSPNSIYVFMLARALDGNKYLQERLQTGGSATGNGGSVEDSGGFPVWLKITRIGDTFIGSASSDGKRWTDVGAIVIKMRDPVLVGLAVTSHSTGNITTGIASDLTIDGVEPKFADMTSEDIGTVKDETKEFCWRVANLEDINDDRNLSNGIYGGEYGDMSNYVFYGIVDVISPRRQSTVLHLAQDDDAKVWINGDLVITSNGWTGGATETRPFDVDLRSGHNIMMVKVSEGGGGDYLNARFDAEDLEFSTSFAGMGVSAEGKAPTAWGNVKAN
jgi:hypothetical protein